MANGIYQTSFSQRPDEAVAGALAGAFDSRRVTTKIARGDVKAGYGVFRTPNGAAGTSMLDPGEVYHQPDPAAAADVDAFMTTIGSTTGIQTFDTTDFDGVVGADEMFPPRLVTLVLSNHADWDATNAILTGVDEFGQTVSEALAIPNSGNATVTSTTYFKSITGLVIPAQSGTGGTATLGIAALTTLTAALMVGVALRQIADGTQTASSVFGYPGARTTGEANYVDGDAVPVLQQGTMYVFTEEAVVDGDPVYVRITSGAGGTEVGAFRNDADTASAVLLSNAVFERSWSAGVAKVRFKY